MTSLKAGIIAMIAGMVLPVCAAAQESAVEFNRQEWLRRSGGAVGASSRSVPVVPRQAPAHAPAPPPRDFFSALFGARPSMPEGGDRARITITPDGRPGGPEDGSGPSGGVGSYAFCVRTCDGRYFPLQGKPSGAGDDDALRQCSLFCPAAKMEVYYTYSSNTGIEGAANVKGKPYTSLASAFVFRERLVPNCTCTSDGQVGGMNHIAIKEDPTLRRGDIVMTQSGARVFTGGGKSRPPYRDRDFVAPERFPDLPAAMRKRIAELTVL